MNILTTIFVDPFLNLLIGIVNVLPRHDLGVAIIVVTLIVRLILYPLSAKQIRAQKAMQDLQPRINEIREKHKDDREQQTKALMEFYKKNQVNPLASCGPLLLQTAFIYPLFFVFRLTISGGDFADRLYPFISHPPLPLDSLFLGTVDLAQPHNIVLAVITAMAQFIQSWMLIRQRKKNADPSKPKDTTAATANAMAYIFPLLTGYFAYTFPAGLALYWFASTIFAIIQQLIIMRTTASRPTLPHVEVEEVVVK